MRFYLEYQMKMAGVTKEDLVRLLHVSEKTIRNKISGSTDFTWSEARKIKTQFFPGEDYEKLFEQTEAAAENGSTALSKREIEKEYINE